MTKCIMCTKRIWFWQLHVFVQNTLQHRRCWKLYERGFSDAMKVQSNYYDSMRLQARKDLSGEHLINALKTIKEAEIKGYQLTTCDYSFQPPNIYGFVRKMS